MSNTCEPLPELANNHTVIDKINTKNYFNPFDINSCMIEYLMAKNFSKTPCWHFKLDGHEAWADKLETRLRILKYVE